MKVKQQSFLKKIKKGVRLGVSHALAEHKQAGRSIVVFKKGKVVEIPAEKIKIPKTK